MKKIAFKSLFSGFFGLVAALVMTLHVSAMTPTLSLTNDSYGSMQVTVYGDANMPIILDYYANGQLNGAGIIGYTNYSGYFSGSLNQGNYYAIPTGAQVFVMVNGQQSATITWQNYGYNNYNQYNYNNCYSYNNYYNYNNYPCNNNNYYYSNPISVSNSNVQVTVGNTATVSIYGGSNTYYNQYNYNYGSSYYVSNNNSNIASTSINGNTLSIYGMNPGTTSVNVCSNNGGNGCTTVTVTVNGQYYYNNNGYYNYNGYYQYPYNNNNGYYWYWSPTYNCWMHY